MLKTLYPTYSTLRAHTLFITNELAGVNWLDFDKGTDMRAEASA
jgi:hypothetical protein